MDVPMCTFNLKVFQKSHELSKPHADKLDACIIIYYPQKKVILKETATKAPTEKC